MGPGIIRFLHASAGRAHRLHYAVFGACLAAILPAPAMAAPPTATANIGAAIIDSSSIVRVEDMVFGQIVQPSAPGTIVLAPGASATCTATGGLVRSGLCKAAHFSVNGKKNNRIKIRDTNGGTIVLTNATGSTMTVTNLQIAVSQMSGKQGAGGWDFGSWQIDAAAGIADFWIGGTLNVATSQEPGTYVGLLNMQIQLN
jgi:hypothetical protein